MLQFLSMNWFESLLLGIVQGLTEPLPISSSAHLMLFGKLLGIAESSLYFDAALHLGTSLAIFLYFRSFWLNLFSSLINNSSKIKNHWVTFFWLLTGIIPAGLIGLLFDDKIEAYFHSSLAVSIALVFGSLVMFVSQRFSKSIFTFELWPWNKTWVVGLSQILAFIPGISRSGVSTSVGLLTGLDRNGAFTLSFLLGAPLTLAAGFWSVVKILSLGQIDLIVFVVGLLSSLIFGWFGLLVFERVFKKVGWWPFILYRLVLAGVVILSII